ncbi:hypothetical protein HRbin21_01046 [bacterium HR21]|nr:hypothetical protein HRbin21_01046 [bacterium HR21]
MRWLVWVLLCCGLWSASAQLKVVTLVRGTVVDRQTGTPVGTEFDIRDATTGKILQQGRSDSRRGTFEAVLQPGQRYVVTFRGYNVLRQSDTIELPASKEYSEVTKTFTVTLLRPGMELFRLHAFDPGKATLRPSASATLEELKQLLNRNRSLRVTVQVSILDTRIMEGGSRPNPPRQRKKRGSAQAELPPSPTLLEQAQKLANARAEALRQYLLPGVRDGEERIRFTLDIPPLPIVRPIPEAPTVVVFVDQVRELVE